MYHTSRWNSGAHGSMTESAIRALHQPPGRWRVSKYIYGPGDEVEGTSRRCTGYALEGRFLFASKDGTASFEEGDMFRFSGGDYSLKVAGSASAVIVWVWELGDVAPGLL